MATRKIGSRPIVVNGVSYRSRIRHRATFLQADYGSGKLHVAVQLATNPGSVLVLQTDRPHPADWSTREIIPVRPSDIKNWINQALPLGWNPSKAGPTFDCEMIHTIVRKKMQPVILVPQRVPDSDSRPLRWTRSDAEKIC